MQPGAVLLVIGRNIKAKEILGYILDAAPAMQSSCAWFCCEELGAHSILEDTTFSFPSLSWQLPQAWKRRSVGLGLPRPSCNPQAQTLFHVFKHPKSDYFPWLRDSGVHKTSENEASSPDGLSSCCMTSMAPARTGN